MVVAVGRGRSPNRGRPWSWPWVVAVRRTVADCGRGRGSWPSPNRGRPWSWPWVVAVAEAWPTVVVAVGHGRRRTVVDRGRELRIMSYEDEL